MSGAGTPATRMRVELSALFRWWLHELRDLGEAILGRVAPRAVTRTVIRIDHAGEPIRLAEVAPNTRTVIVLPPDQVLRQDLVLPDSVERDLDQVIALYLERDLPLSRDQVCVHYSVVRRSREERRISVRILIARREQIEKFRERAQSCGVKLVRVGVEEPEGGVAGNFLQARTLISRRHLTAADKHLLRLAAVLAACLIGIVVGQWIYERVMVAKQVRQVSEVATRAHGLASRFAREAAPAQALAALVNHPDATDVLVSLTASVPASSWVYDLQITARSTQRAQIKLAGFSPAATTLMDALEQLPQFEKVQLESALSAGLGTAQDRLQLIAGWRREGESPGAAPVGSPEGSK